MHNVSNILNLYKGLWKREKMFYKGDYDYRDKFIFKLVMALDDANMENKKMLSEIEKLQVELRAAKRDNEGLQNYIIKTRW